MGQPPYNPHDPNQQPPPQPYGQPQYPPQGYPGYGYQQPMPQPQTNMNVQQVQQVGYSVTKPAWTIGQILLVVFTGGLAWPFIWLKRRSRTTVTRHR